MQQKITMQLRNYQQKAIEDLRVSYGTGHRAPLFVLPTGGGKTFVFTHLTQMSVARGKRVLILVHRSELLEQASRSLTELGVPHGLIGPKYPRMYSYPVQIASVQTLVRRMKTVPEPDLIIIDEGHHAVAGTWGKICKNYANAKILGVTATPCRSDNQGLSDIYDDLVLGPSISDLIDEGYLVKPRVFAPKTISVSGIKKIAGDYAASEIAKRASLITGDCIEHYRKYADKKPAIAFCASINHAKEVADSFCSAGYRALWISGSTPDDIRKKMIELLRDGGLDILTSCDIISEGTDIPRVECAILLRPTQSLSLYLQQVGRVLRPFPGKSDAIILDHAGNVMRHGMPQDDREWELTDGIKKDSDESRTESIRQCEVCFAVFSPRPTCPQCGHQNAVKERKIDFAEGELTELQHVIREKRREVGRARTLEELQRIAAQRGYKKGWAYHVYNTRRNRAVS